MRSVLLIFCCFIACSLNAQWVSDILGNSYEMRYVSHPNDYSGKVRSTIIRHRGNSEKYDYGILYIHGFNDYFFQAEMGETFAGAGYNFYAVDLRKYGRSILPGQIKCEARDYHEYFADIDSAIATMKSDGVKQIVLMGHSNGGLISALYTRENKDCDIAALILNSPFMDWNLNWGLRNLAVPIVALWGEYINPSLTIPQGDGQAYGKSLHKDYFGEWDFNTTWKTLHSPDVTAGWINAVTKAQKAVTSRRDILIPILLMRSDKSVYSDNDTLPSDGDAVLSVDDISTKGRLIGPNVTEFIVIGGLHDLLLSKKGVRNAVYNHMINWCDSVVTSR